MECGAWSGGCPNSPAGGRSCRFRGCLGLLPGLVDHGGGEVAKRLVGTPRVVALEPFRQSIAQGVHGGVLEEIDLLVFHAPPQPLDEDVVHPAPTSVHADFNAQIQQLSRPLGRGELAALVGVENFRNVPCGLEGVVESFQAKAGFHGVGYRPAKHLARMPVHHRAQVGVATGHRHVGDVRAPDVVRARDGEVAQQAGILAVAAVRDAGARLAPDRLVADLAPEPLQAFAVDFHAVIARKDGHQAAASQAGIDHVDLVQQPLDADVLRVLQDGLIIHRRAGDAEQFTLSSHADFGMIFFDQLGAIPHRPSCFDFLRMKSNSMVSCPILAWRPSR